MEGWATFKRNMSTPLPSVVAFAEDHAAPGVARVADFRQCRATVRALEATVVPIPIHRQQQPSFDYLTAATGTLLDPRWSTWATFLLQQKKRTVSFAIRHLRNSLFIVNDRKIFSLKKKKKKDDLQFPSFMNLMFNFWKFLVSR